MMNDAKGPYVGRREPSYKGSALVAGVAKYTNDLTFPRQLYAQLVRSPHANAQVVSVDFSAAGKLSGVVLTLDGAGAAQHLNPIPHYCDPAVVGGHSLALHCLANGVVRFEGQSVAVVVAEDKITAAEAASRVKVEYKVLPAVIDARSAMAVGAPLVVPEWGTNTMVAIPFTDGDCDAAFARADCVVKSKLRLHRFSTQPIETRAYNAVWDAEERMLTLYGTVQSPHPLRHFLSRTLRMPENRIRVVAPQCGGSFGLKMHGHPEEALICLLAKLSRRPVKWVESREECLLAGSREQDHDIEFAVTSDGKVLAVRDRYVANVGAPSATAGWCMAYLTGLTMPGPYDIPNINVAMNVVVTNKAPWNSARGYGKEATAIALEFMMDKTARRLGLDPAEVRLRNFIPTESFPSKRPTGLIFDSGDYGGALRKALAAADYTALRARQAEMRKRGRLLGIGIAYEVVPEGGALPGTFFSGFDTATVKVDPAGFVTVSTGVTDPGTGNATGIAQIVADELGVRLADVRIVQGDTETCPYGVGNYSGRSIIKGGGAAALSARKVKLLLSRVAAAMLSVPEDSVDILEGAVTTSAKPEARLTVGEVSFIAHTHANDIASCIEPPLEVTSTCRPDWIDHTPDDKGRLNSYTTYANGAYIAVLEIDPETGVIDLQNFVVAHDCGKVINPDLVEGQMSGAIAMGIGGMLSENLHYDAAGHQTTRDLCDYVMPRQLDVPPLIMEHHDMPNPVTLYGVKGVGESGVGGSLAALMNAVNDALVPTGAEITEFPLTAQNIWSAIQGSKRVQAERHGVAA